LQNSDGWIIKKLPGQQQRQQAQDHPVQPIADRSQPPVMDRIDPCQTDQPRQGKKNLFFPFIAVFVRRLRLEVCDLGVGRRGVVISIYILAI
jgi:hypothetical protein